MMSGFKILLEKVNQELKPLGFKKSGMIFYIKKFNNWGLIHFHKSRGNSGDSIKFTINMGICSDKIRSFFGSLLLRKPDLDACHYRERVGFIMPIAKDYWWTIDRETDSDYISNEVVSTLRLYCIPELERSIADNSLEAMWIQGKSPGITDLDRYIYLTTLLKVYEKSNLQEVAKEMMIYGVDKPFEGVIDSHLRRLNVKF